MPVVMAGDVRGPSKWRRLAEEDDDPESPASTSDKATASSDPIFTSTIRASPSSLVPAAVEEAQWNDEMAEADDDEPEDAGPDPNDPDLAQKIRFEKFLIGERYAVDGEGGEAVEQPVLDMSNRDEVSAYLERKPLPPIDPRWSHIPMPTELPAKYQRMATRPGDEERLLKLLQREWWQQCQYRRERLEHEAWR